MHMVYEHVWVLCVCVCVCVFLKDIFTVFLKTNSGNNFLLVARKETDFSALRICKMFLGTDSVDLYFFAILLPPGLNWFSYC